MMPNFYFSFSLLYAYIVSSEQIIEKVLLCLINCIGVIKNQLKNMYGYIIFIHGSILSVINTLVLGHLTIHWAYLWLCAQGSLLTGL